jgi:hypothetical protein
MYRRFLEAARNKTLRRGRAVRCLRITGGARSFVAIVVTENSNDRSFGRERILHARLAVSVTIHLLPVSLVGSLYPFCQRRNDVTFVNERPGHRMLSSSLCNLPDAD